MKIKGVFHYNRTIFQSEIRVIFKSSIMKTDRGECVETRGVYFYKALKWFKLELVFAVFINFLSYVIATSLFLGPHLATNKQVETF